LITLAIVWLPGRHRTPRDSWPFPNGDPVVINKRKAQHLLGETIRDIGILVVVFGPLDAFFQEGRFSALPLALMVGGGLLCIALGIMIEAKE
jgi:hypothetical protein